MALGIPITRADRERAGDKPPDQRSAFQRDRDRILYCSAFRRLGAITQVVSPMERAFVHNRLTHTLKVAQIARRVAEKLIGEGLSTDVVDPDVCEAAALAHDLGHPPFGHIAEDELDRLALASSLLDGFNGNAQSFRIVTQLAIRDAGFAGLNLTRATLDAILKYPWFRETGGRGEHKWGAYRSEQDDFFFARALHSGGSDQRSVEAEIMDWTDDVAYAIHDLEDFYRAGLIPLPFLLTDDVERDDFLSAAAVRLIRGDLASVTRSDLDDAFDNVIRTLPVRTPFRSGRQQRADLRSATGTLIGRYVADFTVHAGPAGTWIVEINQRSRLHVALLKQLTWHYVIESPALATQQHGQRQIIRSLFQVYSNDARDRTSRYHLFPEVYREQLRGGLSDEMRTRLVVDLIASMTEQQAIDLHQRLTGASMGSVLDRLS